MKAPTMNRTDGMLTIDVNILTACRKVSINFLNPWNLTKQRIERANKKWRWKQAV